MRVLKNAIERLLKNQAVFIILNTAVWLGVLLLLLTDPFRLTIGALVVALALGSYLLYSALSPKMTRGMAYPGLMRGLSTVFGLFALILAFVSLRLILTGETLPRRQRLERTVNERILRAAKGSTHLDLSDLALREVPPEVWQQTHVTRLQLNDNRLTELPPEISNLTQLERLQVWNNRLERLPAEMGTLSHLVWLDVSRNRLTELPPELGRCRALTHVWLEHNRFTSFPDVLLDLPNLELLFLAGNRMGPLPASIAERAADGSLNLWYEPNASGLDGASVFVITLTFVAPVVLAWVVNRRWARHERTQQQAARRRGAVFPIPPLLRSPTLFVFFALLAISLLMLAAGLNGEATGVTLRTGVGLFLLFSPLMIGALILLRQNTGMVVLTREGIVLRRPGRERFLPYTEITELRSRPHIGGLAVVVRGTGQTLRIPRTVKNLPQLYQQLLNRAPSDVQDAIFRKPAPPPTVPSPEAVKMPATAPGEPVYAFSISRRMWMLYIAGTVLLILIYLGLGLLGLWTGLAQGKIPPVTPDWLRSILIFFGMISLIFVPAIVFVISRLVSKFGPFKIEQPVALELYPDKLRYRFPRGPWGHRDGTWHERLASELERVELEPLPYTVRARVDGALVSQKMVRYLLLLTFDDDTRLALDQERAAQWGETTEELYALIKRLYGK
jgi:hypothetical protein